MERLTEKEAHQSPVELSLLGVSWRLPWVVGHTGKCWLVVRETLEVGSLSVLALPWLPLSLLHGAQPVRLIGGLEWSQLLLLPVRHGAVGAVWGTWSPRGVK